MGQSVIGLGTNQKREQAGPPFVSGSADNGLSVAPAGEIVLGQDVGQAGNPAVLLSDREIPMGGAPFAVVLNDTVLSASTRMDGGSITVVETAGNINATISAQSTSGLGNAIVNAAATNGSIAILGVTSGTDIFQILSNGGGFIIFNVGALSVWSIDTASFFTQIGPTLVAHNNATLQVTGTLTNRIFTQGVGAGATNIDRDLDSGKLFENSAAATLNMPNMAGANNRSGFYIRVACGNAAGVTVQFNSGQVLRFGSLTTSAGGTLSSTDVGAYAVIVHFSGGNYYTESFNGAWTLT